ncbi:hypothetical protein EC973_007630 [Apophysomyces ossiformis]|uniref:Alpha-1,3-mannosyltransferase n=1 Tax=Apophysomyces ossiformis TaxID=679940 RepID=A0A8H7BRK4_9FUNG|nr:hypothetical protein EC973_007630 [Apophysomyces ossiformis]
MLEHNKPRFLRAGPLTFLLVCIFLILILRSNGRDANLANAHATGISKRQEQENQRYFENHASISQRRPLAKRRSVYEPVVISSDEDLHWLSNTHDIAIPTPVRPWTDQDTALLHTSLGQSYVADLLTSEEVTPDFKSLTFQQRVFKALYQYFDPILSEGSVDVASSIAHKEIWSLYEQLEETLYPWLRPHWKNAFEINRNTSGRGIVICIGNSQFQYAATTIRAIREVLKSDLPIEVFYIREDDLSVQKRQYLENEFSHIKIKQIDQFINDWYTRFNGWSLKPYAILASSFNEVLLMDADVYFFKNPDMLFEDPAYQKTGSLFFYDRTLFPNWENGRLWLQSFLPTHSSLVKRTRWWNLKSAHEQESGVVLVNKQKSLLGLLAACKMNDKREREQVTYKHAHGDKETFWIGYEMMQTPYAFVRSFGAVLGGLGDAGDPTMVCGNQLHLGTDQEPLWWNGGLLRDKNKWPDRYLTFTHYATGEDWEFKTSCIKETDGIRKLSTHERNLTSTYLELDRQRRIDEARMDQGNWKPSI